MSTLNVGAIDYTTGVAIKSQAVNTQTGTTYTFVASDAGKLVSASNASPVTFTIPPQSSVTWGSNAVLKVVNYGAGALTVNGGSGVTVTNTAATVAQFESAAAIRTGSDAWTIVPFGGKVSGLIAEVVIVAGGGGGAGGQSGVRYAGGGGGGMQYRGVLMLPKGIQTVTVGAGGAGGASASLGANGSSSSILIGTDTLSVDFGDRASGNPGGAGGNVTSGIPAYAHPIAIANGGNGGFGDVTGGGGSSGYTIDITGSGVNYGAGGGGSRNGAAGGTSAGAGGNFGVGGNAAANRGGGGGGGDPEASSFAGGNGGSGVVFVRYLTANASGFTVTASNGSSSTVGSYTLWTFNSSGSLTIA